MSAKAEFRFRMIELWRGELTAGDIVRRYARSYRSTFGRVFSQQRLNEIWAAAKAQGNLPNTPRPHFIRNVIGDGEPILSPDDLQELETEDMATLAADIERSERLFEQTGLRIPDHDPLLQALRLVHAEPWRRLDGMPAPTLRMELSGFTPSPSRVRQLAAIRDTYVGALMRKPAARSIMWERTSA